MLAVVVPRETDDSDDGRFSLTAFAAGPSAIQLSDPPPDLPFTTRVEGTFLGRSAGGSPAYPSFIDNPMYELTIRPSPGELQRSPAASLKLALAIKRSTDRVTERQPIGVNVKLLWGTRGRVVESVRHLSLQGTGCLLTFNARLTPIQPRRRRHRTRLGRLPARADTLQQRSTSIGDVHSHRLRCNTSR